MNNSIVQTSFYPASALLWQRLTGNVDKAQLPLLVPNLNDRFSDQAHPDLSTKVAQSDVLVDLSNVGALDSNYSSIASLVRRCENSAHAIPLPRRIAFWSPGDLAFGICRMLEQVAQDRLPIEMLVARDFDEAIAHLGRRERNARELEHALEIAELPPLSATA